MPPRSRSPLARVLADLGRAFARVGVDWYLFGAQAATLRGLRRVTVDVDVTAVGEALDGPTLVHALRRNFALRVPDADEFILRTRVVPLVHRSTGIDLDLVLGGPGLESWFLGRCESMTLEGTIIRVPLAQDLVIMKVIAGRDRDLEDVFEIMKFDGDAVDVTEVRDMLGQIEAGIGESGLLTTFDRVVARLDDETSQATVPIAKRRATKKKPRRG